MTKRNIITRKRVLLEGDSKGRLPEPRFKKWGWWFWPTAVIGLFAGSVWGMKHIEGHLEEAAPHIVRQAGFNPAGLTFNARHRMVNVHGDLPSGVSASQLEYLLANYKGPEGESIRKAVVHVNPTITEEALSLTPPTTPTSPSQAIETTDIRVTANVVGRNLELIGIVPMKMDEHTILEAAEMSFEPENIENNLFIAEQRASIDQPDLYINNFASLISNLQTEVTDAQLNLDNAKITGEIHTSTLITQRKLQAVAKGTEISVFSSDSEESVASEEIIVSDEVIVSDEIIVSDIFVSDTENEYQPQYETEILTESDSLQTRLSMLEPEILANVIFAQASNELAPSAFPVLNKVVDVMLSWPGQVVTVGGHTDSRGNDNNNQQLSERRAEAVVEYLISNGVQAEYLQAVGFGESQPASSNDTADGRANNRRVEFRVLENQITEFND